MAGSSFKKTWRFRNTGSCTWTSGYLLIFDHGERMNAPDAVPVTTGNIAPNETVDVSVDLVSPSIAGNYQANFRLRSADNQSFGVGANGEGTFWVKIVVPGPTTPAPRIPNPPANLRAVQGECAGSSIGMLYRLFVWRWDDMADNETGYRVTLRSQDSNGQWSVVETFPANTTSYSQEGQNVGPIVLQVEALLSIGRKAKAN
jgi:hypothetical protein